MKKLLVALLLFSMSSVFAYTDPEPGGYGISAEWLYMLNSIDQPYFILDSNTNFLGENKANDQSWHSGYRIEGKYQFCNCENDLRVRWTHFPEFNDSKSVSGFTNGQSIFVPPNTGSGNYTSSTLSQKTELYYLDVLLGQKAIDRCRFHLALQGGVQYAHIDFKEKQTLSGNPTLLNTHSELRGIGPAVGAEFDYCLSDCLSVVGRAQATMLASRRKASLNDTASTNPYDVKNEPYWRFIPASDLRFGLSYEKPMRSNSCFGCCFGNYTFDLELGYEFITYYNGVERILYVDDAAEGTCFNEMMNLTLHGPYVHLGVKF